jgi:hypothetical protein
MNFVKVVRGSTTSVLETKINDVLNEFQSDQLVDIKLSGAYDGERDDYLAVILFKTN